MMNCMNNNKMMKNHEEDLRLSRIISATPTAPAEKAKQLFALNSPLSENVVRQDPTYYLKNHQLSQCPPKIALSPKFR